MKMECLKMEHILVQRRRNRRNNEAKRYITLRANCSLRDMSNPFNDHNFVKYYRLTPEIVLHIIEDIRNFYPRSTNMNSIPIELKFLSALHFYAQGSYQKPDGRDAYINLSQASVSRAIEQTTNALNKAEVLTKWIKFPRSENETRILIDKNYRRFNIPGVIGYVDGTHILIKKPNHHEELFVNRKGSHSLNVQMICDSELLILNVNARYPGSTHDSFIWRSSSIRDHLLRWHDAFNCWLLGDSGYPLEPWLMTPILYAPPDSPEAKYTEMHIKSRNCIERCFGLLNERFRCLHRHRILEYNPVKAGYITNACAVLHNICINARLPEPEIDEHIDNMNPNSPHVSLNDPDIYNRGQQIRSNLVFRLF